MWAVRMYTHWRFLTATASHEWRLQTARLPYSYRLQRHDYLTCYRDTIVLQLHIHGGYRRHDCLIAPHMEPTNDTAILLPHRMINAMANSDHVLWHYPQLEATDDTIVSQLRRTVRGIWHRRSPSAKLVDCCVHWPIYRSTVVWAFAVRQSLCTELWPKYNFNVQSLCTELWPKYNFNVQSLCTELWPKYNFNVQSLCTELWPQYSFNVQSLYYRAVSSEQSLCTVLCPQYGFNVPSVRTDLCSKVDPAIQQKVQSQSRGRTVAERESGDKYWLVPPFCCHAQGKVLGQARDI